MSLPCQFRSQGKLRVSLFSIQELVCVHVRENIQENLMMELLHGKSSCKKPHAHLYSLQRKMQMVLTINCTVLLCLHGGALIQEHFNDYVMAPVKCSFYTMLREF